MANYTPFDNHARTLIETYTRIKERGGPVAEGTPSGGSRDDRRRFVADSPLSNAHNRPQIEYRASASLVKASRGINVEQVGGGMRGDVKGFSIASRRRLLYTIGGIKRGAYLPYFITLTYPEKFPSPSESKRHLKIFFQRFTRQVPHHGSIWKLEPQERGAPHYHILTWGCTFFDLARFIPETWYEVAGDGDTKHLDWHFGFLGNGNKHCVQEVHSWRGVWSYASKYLGKIFDVSGWENKWTGRYWGIINRDNVPFGELKQVDVTHSKAVEVMRYGRRFSHRKQKSNRSMTILCDADQWIEKLQIGGDANQSIKSE